MAQTGETNMAVKRTNTGIVRAKPIGSSMQQPVHVILPRCLIATRLVATSTAGLVTDVLQNTGELEDKVSRISWCHYKIY